MVRETEGEVSMTETIHQHRPRFSIVRASVKGVADRWRKQYPDDNRSLSGGRDTKKILDALDALPIDADPKAAADIIGNMSWTHPYCESCEQPVAAAVEFGEENRVTVCISCLDEARSDLRRKGK